jgi:hypothetical protein
MSETQIDLLIAYIDAKIAEHAAETSSDGGMRETIRTYEAEKQLRAALAEKEEK